MMRLRLQSCCAIFWTIVGLHCIITTTTTMRSNCCPSRLSGRPKEPLLSCRGFLRWYIYSWASLGVISWIRTVQRKLLLCYFLIISNHLAGRDKKLIDSWGPFDGHWPTGRPLQCSRSVHWISTGDGILAKRVRSNSLNQQKHESHFWASWKQFAWGSFAQNCWPPLPVLWSSKKFGGELQRPHRMCL